MFACRWIMHLLILLPLVDFRMGILVALAPPQSGIVASEDCLLPLPLALSWKVRIFIPKWSQFSAKHTTCCIWSGIVGVWWVHSTVYNIRTQKEVNLSIVCAAHTNFQFKHCFLYIKIITALKKTNKHVTFNLPLQTRTVFVWSRTACRTAEGKISRKECSFQSGCPFMKSTTSSCTTYWTPRPPCSPGRESHCG